MPIYEYECPSCGPFTELTPMAQFAEPQDCPSCGTRAPRVLLTAPRLGNLASPAMAAHAVNEKSRHEPALASQRGHVHGPGCGCGGSGQRAAHSGGVSAKSFPGRRPWMISH